MGIVSDCPLNLHICKYRLEQLSDLTRAVSLCCEQQLTEKLTTVSKRVSVECSVANLSPLHPPSQRPHRRGGGKTARVTGRRGPEHLLEMTGPWHSRAHCTCDFLCPTLTGRKGSQAPFLTEEVLTVDIFWRGRVCSL